jgi:hypothetical protein
VFSNKEIGQYNGAFNLSLGSDPAPTAGSYSSLDAMIAAENDIYVEIGFDPAGGNSYTEVFTRMPLQATAFALRAKYASHASTAFQFHTASSSSGYSNPTAGMVYYDTTDSVLKVYNGSSWVNIGSGTGDSLWTDAGTFTHLDDTTSHFVLGSDSYTAIGSDSYSTYVSGLSSRPPFSFDMGAKRLTLSGDQAKSGLTVHSSFASTDAWPLVSFKASSSNFDNVILEVVQEGTGNLLSLKKGSTEIFAFENALTFFMGSRETAPTVYANRLYNVGGTLYWNGSALGTGSGSLWTDEGTYTRLTSSTDNLVIGGTTPSNAAFFFDVANERLGIGVGTPTARLEIAGVSSFISNTEGDLTISAEESVVIKAQNTDPNNLMEWQNSSGTILLAVNSSGDLNLGTGGAIKFNETSSRMEISNDKSTWLKIGDLPTEVLLSAEYPGAVLSADGTSNVGSMISDNEGVSSDSMNYYEWLSSETSLNDYDVRVRFRLPSNFSGWGTTGGVKFYFATEATGTTNNKASFYIYEQSSGTVDGSSENQASSSAGVWTSTTVAGSGLTDCVAAGDVCMFVIKMFSANDSYVRVGDISIKYDRTL